jgi:hypothetical protein
MIRWGRGRNQSRECCIVIPIGCLFSVMVILVCSGLALVQILEKGAENLL